MKKNNDNTIKFFDQEKRIQVNPFYESLIEKKLTRNHETGEYSFGKGQEQKLDKAFGFDNSVYFGVPDEKTIKLMTGATIMLGIMGYEISDFTSSTMGILASYKSENGKQKTILFSHLDGDNGHVFKILQDVFDEQGHNFDDDQRARIGYTLSTIGNAEDDTPNKNPEDDIFNKAVILSSLSYGKMQENLESAYKKFIQVDNQNCNDNDVVLEDIIMKTAGCSKQEAKKINKPLFDKLIEEYQIYNGKEDENGNTIKDRTILNKSLKSKMEGFSNFEYAFANANACSTDYFGAQTRYAFDECLKLSGQIYAADSEIELATEKIAQNMAAPDNLYTQTAIARDAFGRWLNETYGLNRTKDACAVPQKGE